VRSLKRVRLIAILEPRNGVEERIAEAGSNSFALLRRVGIWKSVGVLAEFTASVSNIAVTYRTPFKGRSPIGLRLTPELRTFDRVPMPYELGVWMDGSKMLNVEWDVAGVFRVEAFNRGEWEEMLACEG
jgi:hypothetical protein